MWGPSWHTDYEVTASTCVCAVFFFKEIKLKHNSPTLAPQIKPQTYIHEAKEKRPQFSTSHPAQSPWSPQNKIYTLAHILLGMFLLTNTELMQHFTFFLNMQIVKHVM